MNVTLCVALAAFVFQLETFVVAVALPSMAEHFQMSMAQVALVPILYLLAATLVFLPAGRWADRRGLKRGFVAGATLLCVGTLLCGLAPNAATLLAARTVQGTGGGCMAALGYALIPARLPRERIGSAMGLVSFAAAIGLTTGAPLGGFLTEAFSWRWALLATTPLSGLLAWFAFRRIPDDPLSSPPAPPSGSPARGFCLLALVLIGLLLGLGLAPVWGWRSPRILALLFPALAAAVLLVRYERTTKAPMVESFVWRQRGLSMALLALWLVRCAIGGIAFLMPFYVEQVCAKSAAVSGFVLLGYTATCALTGLGAGAAADRIGSRPMILVATVVGALACGALAATAPLASAKWTALCLAVLGIGTGLFFSPNSRYTLSCAPEGHAGAVAALMALVLNVGTAVGVAAFNAMHAGLSAIGAGKRSYAFTLAAAAFLFACAAVVSRSRHAYAETKP